MGVTTGSLDLPCGRPEPVHSRAQLSTSGIHPSSTGPRAAPPATTGVVHRIHKPYDNDETSERWIHPEYLGKEHGPDQAGTRNWHELRARCWPGVRVALGSVRTFVCGCHHMFVEGRVYR